MRSNEQRSLIRRIADRHDQRRAAGRKRSPKVVAIALAIAIVGTAGVAYAAWQTTASGGSGAGKTALLAVTASGTAPTFGGTNQVHPGSTVGGTLTTQGGDLSVTITQNNGFTLYVDSIQQAGLITASGSCPADTGTFPGSVTLGSDAYVGTFSAGPPTSYTSYTLPSPVAVTTSASAQTITIPDVIGMTAASPNTCQNVTLTVPVTLVLGTS